LWYGDGICSRKKRSRVGSSSLVAVVVVVEEVAVLELVSTIRYVYVVLLVVVEDVAVVILVGSVRYVCRS
jgi:hypothetical protein